MIDVPAPLPFCFVECILYSGIPDTIRPSLTGKSIMKVLENWRKKHLQARRKIVK